MEEFIDWATKEQVVGRYWPPVAVSTARQVVGSVSRFKANVLEEGSKDFIEKGLTIDNITRYVERLTSKKRRPTYISDEVLVYMH